MPEEVTSHHWTAPWPVAGITIRVDELAARLGFVVQTWAVDGLGPARGFGFRAASTRVSLLEELEHSIQYQGERGPYVYADVVDVAKCGLEVLRDELITELGISQTDLTQLVDLADVDAQRDAAEFVRKSVISRNNP